MNRYPVPWIGNGAFQGDGRIREMIPPWPPPAGLRQIGWHGVRFHVPSAFELRRIEPGYLFFGEARGLPILEMKWARVGKRGADPQRYLSKLSTGRFKGLGRKTGWQATAWKMPVEWMNSLPNHAASGFSWNVEDQHGTGIILSCPFCHTLTLIRFFSDPAAYNPVHVPPMLRSFGDHPVKGRDLWSVYDIKAWLPSGYLLESHRFDVGRFEMSFSKGDHQVTLYRWAMAERLLNQTPIAGWAGPLGFSKAASMILGREGEYFEWREAGGKSVFWGARAERRLRLMHIPEKDRVLGMAITIRNGWKVHPLAFSVNKSEAVSPRDPMDELWEGYGLV